MINKRCLRLLCLMMIITLCNVTSAESIDLSVYNDEQLVDLLEQIQQEVVSRGIEKTATFEIGTYVVGNSIPVGNYVYKNIVSCEEMYSKDYMQGMVYVRAVNDTDDEDPSKMYEQVDNANDISPRYLTLEEGDILYSPVPFTLTIDTGLNF